MQIWKQIWVSKIRIRHTLQLTKGQTDRQTHTHTHTPVNITALGCSAWLFYTTGVLVSYYSACTGFSDD